MNPLAKQAGFTLVELVLALAITALIGAAAYASLAAASQSRQAYSERAAQLASVQRFFTVIGNDLRQAAAIENLDQSSERQAAFLLESGSANPLTFNRRGWHNPLASQRSELQRVFYRIEGDDLMRGYWLGFDRVDDNLLREQLLLPAIEEFSLRVLPPAASDRLDRAWLDSWPLDDLTQGRALPAAVEVRVVIKNLGELSRIYELPIDA